MSVNISNEHDWNEFMSNASDALIVLCISAKWCKPCARMKPLLHEFIENNKNPKLKICHVDLDEAEQELWELGMADTVPTFRFVRNGVVIDEYTDSKMEGLIEHIEKNL